MGLLGPNQEDQRKLHAQVNQLLNQRFLLTTLAVTLFGVVAAWGIPKSPPPAHSTVGGMPYAIAAVQSIITLVLFCLQAQLRNTVHLLTTYLAITKASNWEQDWTSFRKARPYAAYKTPITVTFALLNVVIVAFPFILVLVYDLGVAPAAGLYTLIGVGIGVQVLVVGIGFAGWFDSEQKLRDQWIALQSEP